MRFLNPISTELNWSRRSPIPERTGYLFDELEHIVDNFFRPSFTSATRFQSSWDLQENEDTYLVSFEMPGVKKENIKIEIQGNQLLISGERYRDARSHLRPSVPRQEGMSDGTSERFEKAFTLPPTINSEKIEAHYENGVLNVALPKAEAAKSRTIPIQSGKDGFFSHLLGQKKEGSKSQKEVSIS